MPYSINLDLVVAAMLRIIVLNSEEGSIDPELMWYTFFYCPSMYAYWLNVILSWPRMPSILSMVLSKPICCSCRRSFVVLDICIIFLLAKSSYTLGWSLQAWGGFILLVQGLEPVSSTSMATFNSFPVVFGIRHRILCRLMTVAYYGEY
jgi:hypothetical protein